MKKFLNFETLITPALIKILYPTLTVLFLIRYFWRMIAGLISFSIFGMTSSFTALVSFLTVPFILRVIFELALILFRLYEHTFKLAYPDQELTGIVNTMNELKKEAGNAQKNMQQQAQNYAYGQQNQYYDPNQAYNQGYAQAQPGFDQNQYNQNFNQPQQPANYQGQPQNFGGQPNQPTDNPANPTTPQQ